MEQTQAVGKLSMIPANKNKETYRTSLSDFFGKEYQRLTAFVGKLIDNSAEMDPEDLVQDVAFSLYKRADVAEPLENVSAYVYRALKNRVIDMFRKKKNLVSFDQNIPGGQDITLYDIISETRYDTVSEIRQMEIEETLFDLLDCLKEEERFIVVENEINGVNMIDLAQEMNIPVNTLRSKKSRALGKIKDILQKRIHKGDI